VTLTCALQTNEDADIMLKACSEAGVQLMDGDPLLISCLRHSTHVADSAVVGDFTCKGLHPASADKQFDKLCRTAGTMWMHNPRASLMRSVLDDARAVGLLRSVTSSFFFPGT
jgi:hypothetical protein